MTKVKFCGLTKEADILAANELLPDYVGFVFAPKSRRCITPEKAAALKEKLNASICAVGVFIDETYEAVAKLHKSGIIDIAQLHGNESSEYIERLRSLSHMQIIQAFRIKTAADVAAAQKSPADYILLDAPVPGGGTVFDWSLIKELDRPFFLAGGLNPDNVKQAALELEPYAVDVSSGIETDGIKDKEKMRRFLCALKERIKDHDQ